MLETLKKLNELSKEIEILYVEDNEDARNATIKILSKFIKNFRIAQNGEEGFTIFKARAQYIDLVLTDISMPIMNGLDMLTLMKEINPELNSIVISAHSDTQNLVTAIDIGVENFLIKPIDPEKMLHIFLKVLTKIQNDKELKLLQQKNINERLTHAVHISYKTILKNIPFITAIIDTDDTILETNELFNHCFGNKNTLLNEIQTLVVENNELAEWKEFALTFQNGLVENLELTCILEKQKFNLYINQVFLEDAPSDNYLVILINVSD